MGLREGLPLSDCFMVILELRESLFLVLVERMLDILDPNWVVIR